ncbi:hypothetical protein KM043_012520 [Ampulex compressa]|nr:hypothetical protein KM043_012520 [Ampulex compressa]
MSAVYRDFLLVLSVFSALHFTLAQDDVPKVRIKNGTLAGTTMRSRNGRNFAAFRGIPYALPPLGELRFQPPKPAAAWEGVRSAQKDSDICIQRNAYTHDENIVGSEDCLYLNVYTPKLPSNDDGKYGYPVMIWIHSGGWITGSGNSEFYGPKFLLDHDVVLVGMNYRLGPIGFLSTEDLACPGNNGLKDQVQSIRWVHENIAAFGGDPNRITIFGDSAGGASVHQHMISPLSQGLFHRAISESGTVHCPWTLARPGQAKDRAKIVAEHLDCPSSGSEEILNCLRKKDAADIVATDRLFQVFDYDPMIPFRPVIEPDHPGAFLKEDPMISSKHGRLADVPWLTGYTSHEGALRAPGLYGRQNGKLVKQLDEEFMNIAPMSLMYDDTCPEPIRSEVTKKIKEFYFGNRAIDDSTRFDVIDMYSDAWFNHGARASIRDFLNAQSSPIYYYHFAYKGSVSFSKIFGDAAQDYGVSHADDIQYLFPVREQLFPDVPLNEEDGRMVDFLTATWVNFATHGTPTPKITKTVPTKWKPVRSHALEYLHIGNDEIRMKRNLMPERTEFWDGLPIWPDLGTQEQMHGRYKDEL